MVTAAWLFTLHRLFYSKSKIIRGCAVILIRNGALDARLAHEGAGEVLSAVLDTCRCGIGLGGRTNPPGTAVGFCCVSLAGLLLGDEKVDFDAPLVKVAPVGALGVTNEGL